METDKKIRTAVNYYTKNTLNKYFKIWKKYSDRKKKCKNASLKIQPIRSAFDPKVKYAYSDNKRELNTEKHYPVILKQRLQYDRTISDSGRKYTNSQKHKEELRVVNGNKFRNDKTKTKTIQLWYGYGF